MKRWKSKEIKGSSQDVRLLIYQNIIWGKFPDFPQSNLVLRIEQIMPNAELPQGLSQMTYKVVGTMSCI